MERADRIDLGVLLVVWVLPLAVVAGLLVLAGLPVIAAALVVAEVVVAVAMLLARRLPQQRAGGPSARPWLVPLVMVGLLAGVAGLAAALG